MSLGPTQMTGMFKKKPAYNFRKKFITQLVLRLFELSLLNIQIVFEKLTARAF